MNKMYENVSCAGVDVHYQFSTVAFRDGQAKLVGRERLEHRDREELFRRLSRWPKGLPVVLEASFGWGWLSDLMEQAGLEVHLSNCLKVEQMRKTRGIAKTNKKDAGLVSLLPFEKDAWWEVWRPPSEVREHREYLRYRADLVAWQTQTKNRIHALFHRQGIFYEFSDLFGTRGREFLVRLCRDGSPPLSEAGRYVLGGHVRQLDRVRQELAEVGRRLHGQLTIDPLIGRLKTVPGFGLILSHVLVSEIGQLKRFKNQRHLASYSLLAPIARDSGEEDPQESPKGRRLGHRGNRTLKWAFIEAAHGAVRKDPRLRELFHRHTQGGKVNCGRGYIKVARELVKIVYAVWRDERTYRMNPVTPPPQGPGQASCEPSAGRKRHSRSGTGRPKHPMVVAE
jgi:transposase